MIGKKLVCKKDVFGLTAGTTLTMTAIILVAFFLTKKYCSVYGVGDGFDSLCNTVDAFYGTTVGNETVKFYF